LLHLIRTAYPGLTKSKTFCPIVCNPLDSNIQTSSCTSRMSCPICCKPALKYVYLELSIMQHLISPSPPQYFTIIQFVFSHAPGKHLANILLNVLRSSCIQFCYQNVFFMSLLFTCPKKFHPPPSTCHTFQLSYVLGNCILSFSRYSIVPSFQFFSHLSIQYLANILPNNLSTPFPFILLTSA
jgi:hypothetical protein